MSETHIFTVSPDQAGNRIDRVLADEVPGLSRSRAKALLGSGAVRCFQDENGSDSGATISEPSRSVKQGERYKITIPDAEDATPTPEAIPLSVVFEDEDLIVINKPVGMVVHPAPGNATGTLVNALLHHCRGSLSGIGGVRRPGIVHRIDKDTSGLMVAAKSDAAHQGLAKQFADHSIERKYLAIVRGLPQPARGRIEAAIARHPQNRKKMAVRERGRHAVTHYQTNEIFSVGKKPLASLVSCELETGRTHQVRVHMAHLGNALIGDPVYGRNLRLPGGVSERLIAEVGKFSRQALHAAVLGFKHPVRGNDIRFENDLPPDMARLIEVLSQESGKN